MLADYGAEVIWVEPPGGDPARVLQPAAASVFNRGKQSIVLDSATPEGRATIERLAERADVFIESWKPGEADRLGLGFDQLQARNPQLVYCSVTGFGPHGRHRDLPDYEPIVHALIGTMAYQAGHREGPIFEGQPFASSGAAGLAVIGILAALYRRLGDGFGRRVETSLWDGALAFHIMLWGESDASVAANAAPSDTRAMLGRTRNRLITRTFLCADGKYIGIHTGAVGAFNRLMEVLGLADRIKPITSGLDMATPLTPAESDVLEGAIHGVFAEHPRDWWVKRLMEADVCAVEHLPPTTVFDEPQARHNGMIVEIDDPVLGPVEQVAPGIRFDGAPPQIPAPAPTPGRDTERVLASLERPATPSVWRAERVAEQPDRRPLLDGVKVLDFGAYYAGPYSSRALADLGADVIKLEPLAGDQLRGIERPFHAAQAGKRSLAANLKDPALKPAIESLIKWADAVHHNMRPGAAERLGLGRDQVRAINPAVIYLYAPGWGSSGPHMLRQSFAPMLSAYVGSSFEVAGQYNEPLPSLGNEDPGNGLLGAVSLLIGLLRRRRTGEVVACENPQLNAAMGLAAHIVRRASDKTPIGAEALDVLQMGTSALESLYQTADGWLCLSARTDEEIGDLGSALGVNILSDPRFASAEARRENRDLLAGLLRDALAERTSEAWRSAFAATKVIAVAPEGPDIVHRILNDPEQRRIGRVAEVTHPTKGRFREFSNLVRVSDARETPYRLAPGLGEHADEILTANGYNAGQIAGLRTAGAIR
jgi:crotonobetainyl-CoA:carnitine CoA-transferase CaiB-like acyl-CoA transferase